MAPEVRVGVVGWNYPEWRGHVYAPQAKPADFLKQYALRFSLVEAASGRYGMPKKEVVARWASETPDGFEMAVKLPEWVLRKRAEDPDLARVLASFLDRMTPLREAGKLGAVVAQFPPSFRAASAPKLAGFVRALPAGPRWAVELRHDSWWTDETFSLLREAGVVLVWSALADGFRTPPVVTGDSLYVRLFGDRDLRPPFDAKRRDASAELEEWVERIRLVGSDVSRVDVVVSKFLEGYAPGSAEAFARLLGVPLRRASATGQSVLDAWGPAGG